MPVGLCVWQLGGGMGWRGDRVVANFDHKCNMVNSIDLKRINNEFAFLD